MSKNAPTDVKADLGSELERIAEASQVTIEEFLSVALLTPIGDPSEPVDSTAVIHGLPLCLVGLSGLGKTKRSRTLIKAIGLAPHYVYAATKSPEDFGGAYVPDGMGGVNIECVLPAARRCIDAGGGVIVFDEASDAPPRTQAALLSAVDERQFGDRILPNKTRILLLMNPPAYATNGHPLSAPLANRMAHRFALPPPREDLADWILGLAKPIINAEEGERIVLDRWTSFWPQVTSLAAHFLKNTKDEFIHNQPLPESPLAAGPWPSPRTWYMGWRAIATARCIIDKIPLNLKLKAPSASDIAAAKKTKLDCLEFDLLASLVGEAPARVWQTFTANFDLPNPRDMLTNGWTPDAHRLDKTMVSITSMAEFLKAIPKTEAIPLTPNAWRMIKKVMEIGQADLVLPATRVLTKSGLGAHQAPSAEIKVVAEEVTYMLAKDNYLAYLQ